MSAPIPLLHDSVLELADRRPQGRRSLDPAAPTTFQASMRNDFLTPSGLPYKWQELTASLDRTVLAGTVPTVVPARYQWRRVGARTGTPREHSEEREWTFARGQSFDTMLLHTELTAPAPAAVLEPGPFTIGYPGLPKSPAVDLLVLLSWDVVTFEMLCTQMITTPDLREVGGRAELERISGSQAQFQFSDPGAVARFHNTKAAAEHLGYGRFGGRPTAVYTACCLDCRIDVRSGPLTQRGRSSYWVTLQVDLETRDLLCADMTEMIVAVLSGEDGRRVPVQKRRIVRMCAGDETAAEAAQRRASARRADTPAEAGVQADPAELLAAIRLTGRVVKYAGWQISSLAMLPDGMSELALMGFQSVVGTDLAGTQQRIKELRAGLRIAAEAGGTMSAELFEALPDHRRRLEGLLAFGELAVDGAQRFATLDEADRGATRERLGSVSADLVELLTLLGRLERPGRADRRTTDHESEGWQ